MDRFIENFKKGFPFLKLEAAATPGYAGKRHPGYGRPGQAGCGGQV